MFRQKVKISTRFTVKGTRILNYVTTFRIYISFQIEHIPFLNCSQAGKIAGLCRNVFTFSRFLKCFGNGLSCLFSFMHMYIYSIFRIKQSKISALSVLTNKMTKSAAVFNWTYKETMQKE